MPDIRIPLSRSTLDRTDELIRRNYAGNRSLVVQEAVKELYEKVRLGHLVQVDDDWWALADQDGHPTLYCNRELVEGLPQQQRSDLLEGNKSIDDGRLRLILWGIKLEEQGLETRVIVTS